MVGLVVEEVYVAVGPFVESPGSGVSTGGVTVSSTIVVAVGSTSAWFVQAEINRANKSRHMIKALRPFNMAINLPVGEVLVEQPVEVGIRIVLK